MFFKVVGRMTAKFFNGVGKFFFNTSRKAGKSPVGFTLTLLSLVAFGFVLYFTDIFGLASGNFLGLGKSNSTVITPLERKLEPDGRSTEFLNALKAADGTVMYNLLSDDYRKLLKQRGVSSPKIMQDLMEEKLTEITKQKKGRLNYKFTYVIGTKYSDGSVDDNYSGYLETNTARANVEFAFKISNGKITDIQTSEPVATAALGTNKTESKEAAQVGTITQNRSNTAEIFMKGLTTFDADQIWESLADNYKEQLTARGVTKDSIAKVFDGIKSDNAQGAKTNEVITYDGFVYFRTYNFPNGVSGHDYASILSIRDQPREIGYLLVLDASNKIIRLGSTPDDPILSAILKRGQQQQ